MAVGEQRVRIVAGTLRGRRLRAPSGTSTRPTTDRVREAVFSALVSHSSPNLGGGPVLDAFAGSGALGLEALSRGAGPVTFVEKERDAFSAVADNVRSLGVERQCRIVRGDVFSLARRGISGGPFALLLLDPPYTLDQALVSALVCTLADSGSLAEGCLAVWEHGAQSEVVWPAGFEPLAEKRYGTTRVAIAAYEGSAGAQ
jgi:16S rRNA (guanine966-N2)-methyltransferase